MAEHGLASASYDEDVPVHPEDLYLPSAGVKKDTRSRLHMSFLSAGGHVVNACKPNLEKMGEIGCEDEELDEHGRCRHLVGYTDPDNRRMFFKRIVIDHVGGISTPPRRIRPMETLNGANPEMVLKTDVTDRITTCHRVYRADGQAPYPPPENYRQAKARYEAEAKEREAADATVTAALDEREVLRRRVAELEEQLTAPGR
jgi:hypothetical protein